MWEKRNKSYRKNKNNFLIVLAFFVISAGYNYFYNHSKAVDGANKIPVPTSTEYVNDYSKVLDEESLKYIASMGKELEDKTSAQEVVVVIDSLNGRDIEGYANELFKNWGIGQKEKNNGLLILVAIKDKKWRVEVGKGFDSSITSAYSAGVMNAVAKTSFKDGKYGEGIKMAYSTFADDIAKGYNVKLNKNIQIDYNFKDDKNTSNTSNIINAIIKYVVMILIAIIILDTIFNKGKILNNVEMIFFGKFINGGNSNYGNWNSGNDLGTHYDGNSYGDFDGSSDCSSDGGSDGFGGGDSDGGGSSGDW